MSLEEKLRALVAEKRELARELELPVEGIPEHIRLREGKRVSQFCDAIEALLAERQEPPVVEQAFTDGADWKRISGSAIRKAALEEAAQIVKKWNFMACSDVEGLLHEFRNAAAPSSGTGERK